jgi:uncharacterized iron-regulated membrane protein
MDRNIPPEPPLWEPPRPASHPVWKIIGITLAAVLIVGGLFLVAAVALLIIGLNQWGSNK